MKKKDGEEDGDKDKKEDKKKITQNQNVFGNLSFQFLVNT